MQSMFPLEKNRYFPYKRMRASDFSRELQYIDHKFQLLNHWVFGTGPAFGLEVQRLDGESLLVSPGIAVDELGRYLIVDEPAVCRLRTLPGFDVLTGESALLWLSYQEEKKDPVFVAGGQGERQEYAVSAERCAFSLSDWQALPVDTVKQALYFSTVLYEDETVRVRQVIPRILSSQRPVNLRLILENLSLETVEVQIRYAPELSGFHTELDGREIRLERQMELPSGCTTVEALLIPSTTAQSVSYSLTAGGFCLWIHGRKREGQSSFYQELQVVPGDPLPALAARLEALSPQDLWEGEEGTGVPIAGIRFFKYEDGFLLDDVIPLRTQQRAQFPAIQRCLEACGAFFAKAQSPSAVPQPLPDAGGQLDPSLPDVPRHMTTGVVTLNAGLHLKEGKILYSDEIVHNLGPGTVYVEFGIENVYPAANLDRNCTDLLLGDVSLFVQASGSYEQDFDQGVRVHPDKGTFEMALRLKGELRQTSLRLRWFAWRPEEVTAPQEEGGDLRGLEPNVIYAKPGAVLHFTPVFNGGNRPCDFFVPEKQAGLITRDGVYTAPEREGLYQVCAQIRDKPETKVSAFVIVRAGEERDSHESDTV